MILKFILLGNDEFSTYLYKGLVENDHECILVITKPVNSLPAGKTGLKFFARKQNLPVLEIDEINTNLLLTKLLDLDFDFGISAWPHLISNEIIKIPRLGIIGTHPTPLPFGRGRHPLHWQIYMNITQLNLTFFKMNNIIDGGDIILNQPFSIKQNSPIKAVLDELNQAGYKGALKIGNHLKTKNYFHSSQQIKTSTPYFRARNIHDLYIDFRCTAQSICSLLNSYSEPFTFAKILINYFEIPIIKCEITSPEIEKVFTPPGYITEVIGKTLTVKAYDNFIKLTSNINLANKFKVNSYIYPPSYYYQTKK